MNTLPVKLQYNGFEPGEFVNEQKRTYDETIALIESYPWSEQRKKETIDITDPSVTIQNEQGTYMKLAISYNDKYVLYFFDQQQQLYTLRFYQPHEAYPYIQKFFDSVDFEPIDFKKENTWLQRPAKHFITNDFHYTATPKSAFRYLLRTSSISLALGLVVLIMLGPISAKTPVSIPIALVFGVIIFLAGGGLNVLLVLNYYYRVKGKMLIVSRGQNTFYVGDADNPAKYNKADIKQVIIRTPASSRSPISSFSVAKVEFNNGYFFYIPSLWLDAFAVNSKFFDCPCITENGIPYIR